MGSDPTGALRRHVHRAALLGDGAELSDGQLLGRFVEGRDEAAFDALVKRHGPMVWGVCRRVLGDPHDAEDAFQATFLALVRRGGSLRDPGRMAAWLHRVACRAALQARADRARRRARERTVSPPPEPEAPRAPDGDWRPLLDEELAGLAEKYRTAIVLCDLEGKSRAEAAALLGVPVGTLSGRLTTAHRILAKRLTRRGVAIAVGGLAAVLAAEATAEVSVARVAAAVDIALISATGAGTVPASVADLTRGVLRAMIIRKLLIAAGVLTAAVLVLTAGVWFAAAHPAPPAGPTPPLPSAGPGDRRPRGEPGRPDQPRPKDRTLTGHQSTVRVLFSPVGHTLATFSDDKTVQLWDADAGTVRRRLAGHVGLVSAGAFSPDGKVLVTVDQNALRAWDVATGEARDTVGGLSGVSVVAFAPDGKTVATAGGDGKVRVWDAATWKEVRSFGEPPPKNVPLIVFAAAFAPDGKTLAVASTEGHPGPSYLRLWDPETGKLLRTPIDGSKRSIWAVAFSQDGKLLAAGDESGKVTLFETTRWQPVGELEGRDQLRSLAFSPDSRTLALGMRRDVQLWDVTMGKQTKVLSGHDNWVLSVSFSADGKILASGSSDKTARLWVVDPE